MSTHRRLQKRMSHPVRRARRAKKRHEAQRPQAYKAHLAPESQLVAMFGVKL